MTGLGSAKSSCEPQPPTKGPWLREHTIGEGDHCYFNEQTKSLDMHLRPSTLGAAFAVEKPGHMDGVRTLSFQFYHREGFAAFKVFLTFGGAAPPPQRVEQFNAIRDRFARR